MSEVFFFLNFLTLILCKPQLLLWSNVIKSLFGESNPILVSYKDQKVKADIMNESSLWGEYFPVTVIVTADTVLPNRAVVIGLIE